MPDPVRHAVPGPVPHPVPDPLPDVVAAVGTRLAALQDMPLSEHVPAYDEVHRLLQDALARLDEG